MPFLRFSRDKRGVESFALVHTTTNRRGKVRPRVLYWFRTPPDIKVGRQPFDPAVRRALEAQNPDIAFDWRAIVETPIPSADADKWRERRRAERAAKHAAAEEESVEAANGEAEVGGAEAAPAAATVTASAVATPPGASHTAQGAASSGDATSKRRRRRRGGGGRGGNAPRPEQAGDGRDASTPAAPSEPSTEPSGD